MLSLALVFATLSQQFPPTPPASTPELAPLQPSAIALATSTALPAQLARPVPAHCPATWSLQPDGSVQRSVEAPCPADIQPTVEEAMSRWTFPPVSAPTTVSATFYLYGELTPTWRVLSPEEVRKLHWSEAKVKKSVAPRYPEAAKGSAVEGECVVDIHVDERGQVYFVEPVNCPEVFQANALDAAYHTTFYPLKSASGQAEPFRFQMKYKFVMK